MSELRQCFCLVAHLEFLVIAGTVADFTINVHPAKTAFNLYDLAVTGLTTTALNVKTKPSFMCRVPWRLGTGVQFANKIKDLGVGGLERERPIGLWSIKAGRLMLSVPVILSMAPGLFGRPDQLSKRFGRGCHGGVDLPEPDKPVIHTILSGNSVSMF